MNDPSGRRFLLIVNPASGGGAAKRLAPDLVQQIRARSREVEAEFSESLDHATKIAEAGASKGKTVIAVGGDGLISGVVNGVARVPGAEMGIVPFGTANDFARATGITETNAISVILGASSKPIDLGHGAGKFFTCIASVGFDSTVIESALRTSLVKGPLVYPYAVAKSIFSWRPQQFTIEANNETRTFDGFSVAVCNGGSFGGGMKLAPDAKFDDGMFDVVLIKGTSKLRFLRYAPAVFSGTHVRSPDVEVFRTAKIRIDTTDHFLVYADGEVLAPAPLELEVRPAAIRLLVPGTSVIGAS